MNDATNYCAGCEQHEREIERLRGFVKLVTRLNPSEGLTSDELWHLMNIARRALTEDKA